MAEDQNPSETLTENEQQQQKQQNPSKRKPDLEFCADHGSDPIKKPKSDAPPSEEDQISEQEELVVDLKGKGKAVDVSLSESESDNVDDAVDGDFEESDSSDDPLAEVDLDNILPSRTRRRPPVHPGAYIVPPGGDDDDDRDVS
ncbi:hypothetical protein QJS04_geneDACA015381 [Acorus gramineus]|uniref:Uncharacterized protein n=1 Tax=Acorus gramineus TaxID=55184 RepID=A0AAV9A629_ACOGR|nr:hypothetical protein QJS04_geneDACA015381 [Acorus gramineus]